MELKSQHSLTRQHIHFEIHAQLQDLKPLLAIFSVTQIPYIGKELALDYDAWNLDFDFIFLLLFSLVSGFMDLWLAFPQWNKSLI